MQNIDLILSKYFCILDLIERARYYLRTRLKGRDFCAVIVDGREARIKDHLMEIDNE